MIKAELRSRMTFISYKARELRDLDTGIVDKATKISMEKVKNVIDDWEHKLDKALEFGLQSAEEIREVADVLERLDKSINEFIDFLRPKINYKIKSKATR